MPLPIEVLPERLRELIDTAPVVQGKAPTPEELETQENFKAKVKDALKAHHNEGGPLIGYNAIMKLIKENKNTTIVKGKKKKPVYKPKHGKPSPRDTMAYRNNRDTRKAMAQKTVQILKEGQYTAVVEEFHDDQSQETKNAKQVISIKEDLEKAVNGTCLYHPNDLERLARQKKAPVQASKQTRFEVVNETTLAGARAIIGGASTRVCILNFASAKSPGGGFLRGAQAQEEDLAIASGLYACLVKNWDEDATDGSPNQTPRVYYTENHKTNDGLYTDYTIYSPDIPVFRDEDETGSFLEEPYLVSMITSPAPNATVFRERFSQQAKGTKRATRNRGKQNESTEVAELPDAYWDTFQRRIRYVLRVALANGHVNLILGAWGCGVFANDPVRVARMFAAELAAPELVGCFERVRFSILARHGGEDANLSAFKKHVDSCEH